MYDQPSIDELNSEFEMVQEGQDLSADRILLFAVLERAIMDIAAAEGPKRSTKVQVMKRTKVMAEQAKAWIASRNREGINNYERICEVVGYDPEMLRNPKIMRRVIEYYRKTNEERKRDGSKTLETFERRARQFHHVGRTQERDNAPERLLSSRLARAVSRG